jgi:NAD(P)-dependent dehydrogenase (short-subunit alcohol dehydrogenase family)
MFKQDRVAVITGATGNLGSVVARALASEGARLALLSTSEDKLEKLARSLQIPDDRVLTGAFDLATAEGTKQAAAAVIEKYGQVDILIHVVGGWTGGKRVVDTPAEDVSGMLDQHLWTTFYLAQAFVPHLEANKWGRIVAVSSPFASKPPVELSAYAVGKAAQEALILSIAKESASSGVTANILQVRSIAAPNEVPKKASATSAEDITAAILYLCSDEASMVNGARLPLYGG